MIDKPTTSVDANRQRGDAGSTSLSVVLLTPLFIVLMFAAVQAAMWGHARTQARVAAKTAAVQVARQGLSSDDARQAAASNLAAGALEEITVSIDVRSGVVVVTIDGRAPGMLVGTSRSISVTEAIPIEEISPL